MFFLQLTQLVIESYISTFEKNVAVNALRKLYDVVGIIPTKNLNLDKIK